MVILVGVGCYFGEGSNVEVVALVAVDRVWHTAALAWGKFVSLFE